MRGGENVAARHEERPLAPRTQVRALQQVRRRHPRWAHRQAVVRHRDGDGPRRPVVDAVNPQLAVQLVDDTVGAVVARPAHVPRIAVGELRRLARGEVVAVQVQRAVPVRGEVDGVADPHRVAVGAPMRRHPFDHVRLAVEDVELLRPAPLVPLPGPEVAEQRTSRGTPEGRVDHARPVRRQIPRAGLRHRQRNRQPPVGRRQEQPAVGKIRAVTERPEQDRLPVGRPVIDLVVVAPARRQRTARRIVRELPGHAAGRRDDVHLLVTVVLPGEGDARPVGGEPRKQLQPGMGGQAGRQPPFRRCQPEVAGVAEHHPTAVDVRETKQLRLRGRRHRRLRRHNYSDGTSRQHRRDSSKHVSSPRVGVAAGRWPPAIPHSPILFFGISGRRAHA